MKDLYHLWYVALFSGLILITGCSEVPTAPEETPTYAGEQALLKSNDVDGDDDDLVTYEVTIENLTEGQPLTPPVIAIHKKKLRFFKVGEAASPEIQAIAENGNNGPLVAALTDNDKVFAFAEGTTGPLVPAGKPGATVLGFDDSATFMITVDEDAKFLSMATMLICTNDGFTGLDQVKLPKDNSKVFLTQGYDAGTEINTEDFNDMVPPCQALISGIIPPVGGTGMTNPALAEGGRIAHHPGIQGGVDLDPNIHDWTDPVAKVTITMVDDDDDEDDDDDDDSDDEDDD